jgi:hypothetical protein
MKAPSRSPARVAGARARSLSALCIAMSLCASLPLAALAQTVDAHELNLCGSGTPPSSAFSSRAEKASRRVLIPGTNESYGRFCGRLTAPLTDRKTFHASRRQTATAPPATGSCVAPRWTAPRRDPSEAS